MKKLSKLFSEKNDPAILFSYHTFVILMVILAEKSYHDTGKDSGGFSLLIIPFVILPFLIIHILIALFRDRHIPVSQKTGKVATILLWNFGMYFADNIISIRLLMLIFIH